ncbi:uncharacterized protein LOC120329872 isoform X1 [Styela clava]
MRTVKYVVSEKMKNTREDFRRDIVEEIQRNVSYITVLIISASLVTLAMLDIWTVLPMVVVQTETNIRMQKVKSGLSDLRQNLENAVKEMESTTERKENKFMDDILQLNTSIALLKSQLEAKIFTIQQNVNTIDSKLADAIETARVIKEKQRAQASEVGWYIAANNKMYRLLYTQVQYQDAVKKCESLGAMTASAGLRDAGIRNEITLKLLQGSNSHVWAGLTDIAKEGHWVWADGTPSTRSNTNWMGREPNNYRGVEDCAAMDRARGWQINDVPCYDRWYMLCEKARL